MSHKAKRRCLRKERYVNRLGDRRRDIQAERCHVIVHTQTERQTVKERVQENDIKETKTDGAWGDGGGEERRGERMQKDREKP